MRTLILIISENNLLKPLTVCKVIIEVTIYLSQRELTI